MHLRYHATYLGNDGVSGSSVIGFEIWEAAGQLVSRALFFTS